MNLRVRRVQEVFDMVATLPSQGGAVPSCVPKRVARWKSSTLFLPREASFPSFPIKIIKLRLIVRLKTFVILLKTNNLVELHALDAHASAIDSPRVRRAGLR